MSMTIQCAKCKDKIQSKHRHDMVFCKCGLIFIDGGDDYTRIGGDLTAVLDTNNKENAFKAAAWELFDD